MKLDANMFAKMREATQLLQTAGPMAATEAIQRALHGLSMPDSGMPPQSWSSPLSGADRMRDINPAMSGRAAGMQDDVASPAGGDRVAGNTSADILARFRQMSHGQWAGRAHAQPVQDVEPDPAGPGEGKGRFLAGSCSNHAGTRAYKLYVPSNYRGEALPLIVMLHGCKQNPDDFAAGTGMNAVAEEHNCFVVYPGQAQGANMSNCWNWFKRDEQQRDRGEPSLIADITRQVMRDYKVDGRRVYVAGLSAGGAMAAIMAANYPELYAAVGIHSGLPAGAAHDLPSAFAAMGGMPGLGGQKGTSASRHDVPVIVFHGDRDSTVNPCNGDQAMAQFASDAAQGPVPSYRAEPGNLKVEKGRAPNGRSFTKTMQHDDAGKVTAEHWLIHGAGHAWSGGSRKGSYTDPHGPNASREMLRFFYQHQQMQ